MNLEQKSCAVAGCPPRPASTPALETPPRRSLKSLVARGTGAVGIVVALRLGLPFASGDTLELAEINAWLMAGTCLVTLVSLGYAMAETSRRDAVLLFILAFLITWAVEAGGVRWGIPFGWPYTYHAALQPRLWGGIPLLIPLSWYVLLRLPAILLRRWKTRHAAGGRDTRQVLGKALACGLFMGGCSLMLEPLGVALGAWTWSRSGDFFGMPLLNAFGWGLVGFLVHAAYFALEGRCPDQEPRWLQRLEHEVLAGCLLFHLLAFAAVANRLHSWLPALLSVVIMAPPWVFWGVSTWRSGEHGST